MGAFPFLWCTETSAKEGAMTHHFPNSFHLVLCFLFSLKIVSLDMPKVLIQLLNHDLPLDMVLFSKCSPRNSYRRGKNGKELMTQTVEDSEGDFQIMTFFTSPSMSK